MIDLNPIANNPEIELINHFLIFYKGKPCWAEIDEIPILKLRVLNIKPIRSSDDIGKGEGKRVEIPYT